MPTSTIYLSIIPIQRPSLIELDSADRSVLVNNYRADVLPPAALDLDLGSLLSTLYPSIIPGTNLFYGERNVIDTDDIGPIVNITETAGIGYNLTAESSRIDHPTAQVKIRHKDYSIARSIAIGFWNSIVALPRNSTITR